MKKFCEDCGTRLERNGVCPNCDEAAFIMDWQDQEMEWPPSKEFIKEANDDYARAQKRLHK